MALYFTLFTAGLLTIILPCILPLLPIVVGVTVTGKDPKRPLLLALGMVIGFVGITFLLYVVLSQFVTLANVIQIATFYILLLFGIGFLTSRPLFQTLGAILGSLFFLQFGIPAVLIAALTGSALMHVGGRLASRIQQLGTDVQGSARSAFGSDSWLTSLILGLTMGLVWVPCAGPALGFALALVREEPGAKAFIALLLYAIGAALPVLVIGYGGQWMLGRVRSLSAFSDKAKHIGGGILIVTAIALRFSLLQDLQVWLVNNTSFGTFGTRLEEKFFPMHETAGTSSQCQTGTCALFPDDSMMDLPILPTQSRAPEFTGLGTWFNSEPLTIGGLKGKVVLIDFWTYSCINCIRTLPYIQGYAEKFKDDPFVIIGVHTPEFIFEKDEKNVLAAIKKHGLTYPVVQDNDFKTWDAFANRYWPAKYLIDKDGYIRYTHFGEGAYDETDEAIQSLLLELGEAPKGGTVDMPEKERLGPVTGETYLHSRSWPAFGNSSGSPSDDMRTYDAPDAMELHKYYLDGSWQLLDDERMVLQSDSGEIRMKFLGGEINLVLGLEAGAKPATGEVFIDGKKIKDITVDFHDLYELFKGEYGEHELVLKLKGKGVSGYAFTFGG